MELAIQKSFNAQVITPFTLEGKTLYLLFFKQGVPGPFRVVTSSVQVSQSMFSFGDIVSTEDGASVGFAFNTTSKAVCFGSYLLAYSGQFKDSLARRLPKNFDMQLVLKTQYLQVYTCRNCATLVVSPNIKQSIRLNLEV